MFGLTHRKTLLTLLAAASSFVIFSTTEHCFETADRRNAITMVKVLRPKPDSMTIPDALILKHPNIRREEIVWGAVLNSKFYGIVRVTATVADTRGDVEYAFDVNLAGNRLHPASDNSRLLMKTLGERL